MSFDLSSLSSPAVLMKKHRCFLARNVSDWRCKLWNRNLGWLWPTYKPLFLFFHFTFNGGKFVHRHRGQGHYRNIHCNTTLFHIHVHWSISLGSNTNLCQILQASSSTCLETVLLLYCKLLFSFLRKDFYIFSFITHRK